MYPKYQFVFVNLYMYSAVHSEIVSSTSQRSQAERLLGPDGLGAFGEGGEERRKGFRVPLPYFVGYQGSLLYFLKIHLLILREREKGRV